jgi:general L-amino acid transport system substrate-binding protein
MTKSVKYLAGMMLLAAMVTLLACTGEQTVAPAPITEPTAPPTAMAEQPTEAVATPTEAMAVQAGNRLQTVKDRGNVVCANNTQLAGFGFIDAGGNTMGFDVDLCRAVAAAVLGDADAVDFRPTTAAERGPTMQSGQVDMMSRNTTWTSSRDATWGNFAQTMFYDGQGFMVPASLGVSSAMELRDAKVCVQQGTTTELNLQDFSNQNDMNFDIVTFPDATTTSEAYQAGQCDSLTTDRSGLVATRVGYANPDDHVILPDTISEEPLGPVVPHGDDQWYDIVKTTMAMLIYAEAFGITSDSVPTAPTGNTAVDRLFGLEGGYGQEDLGLSPTAAQDVIRQLGNYGEIYDRHLTPLGVTRTGSRNDLWLNGGEIYSAPLR